MKPGEKNHLHAAKIVRDAFLHYLKWQEAQKAPGGPQEDADGESFLDWVSDELGVERKR